MSFIGRRVIVKSDLKVGCLFGGRLSSEEMAKYRGKKTVVKKVSISGVNSPAFLKLKIDKGYSYWSREMLELIEIPEPSKNLLKSGFKIVREDRVEAFILLETNSIISDYMDDNRGLIDYNDDLTHKYIGRHSVKEIWKNDILIALRKGK